MNQRMQAVEVVQAEPGRGVGEAFAIRRRVFVDEQGVPLALEFDAHDAAARHLLARTEQRPVGTLRVRFQDGTAKIERVAVVPEARGLKVGRQLVLAALDLAERAGAVDCLLHAQVQVRGFYATLGFTAFGGTFIEDGILHVAMRRPLRGPKAADDAA